MNWFEEKQALFDELRAREVSGTLTDTEKIHLAELTETLEMEELRQLAPAFAQMQAEQATLRERLKSLQAENKALARLFAQQEQLIADAQQRS